MKKLAVYVVSIVCLVVAFIAHRAPTIVDKSLMIELFSDQGACSGSYIKHLSKTYILTAGHCGEILDARGKVKVLHEDGSVTTVTLVKIDTSHDLMILSSDAKDVKGLELAEKILPNDFIYTLSHPGGQQLNYAYSKLDWYMPLSLFNGLLEAYAHFNHGTAPGSSGAPILDKYGRVVGVLSAGDSNDTTTAFVRLQDIRDFLNTVK